MCALVVKLSHVIDVNFTTTSLCFMLADGRTISAPLEWFPKVRDANHEERDNWRLIGCDIGIH